MGYSCTPNKDLLFYPGIENPILPRLSREGPTLVESELTRYSGQVTSI